MARRPDTSGTEVSRINTSAAPASSSVGAGSSAYRPALGVGWRMRYQVKMQRLPQPGTVLDVQRLIHPSMVRVEASISGVGGRLDRPNNRAPGRRYQGAASEK